MEKVNCTLLAFQKSSIEQQQAQLHQQEMSFHKVQAPVEDTFLTLIKSFHSYRQYKSSGGAMIFFSTCSTISRCFGIVSWKSTKDTVQFCFHKRWRHRFFSGATRFRFLSRRYYHRSFWPVGCVEENVGIFAPICSFIQGLGVFFGKNPQRPAPGRTRASTLEPRGTKCLPPCISIFLVVTPSTQP